jgi:ribosomal protein S12 methylthiotransferase
MGAFIYSDEEGTFSNKQYKDSITTKIKQQRLNELMALQQEILANSNLHKVGQTLKLL